MAVTRARTYPRRPDAHWQPPRDGGKGKWVDDPGGTGTEIAREVRACGACAGVTARDASGPGDG
jgi:hypothetical protein